MSRRIFENTLKVVCELLLLLILLELGLRLGGSAILSWQERRNRLAIQRKGAYRIMCIGESSTAFGGVYSYPSQLQNILNLRVNRVKFSVINKGIPGTNTAVILDSLESNIAAYRPDMVISMMGINEMGSYTLYEAVSGSPAINFFRSLRTYKLARLFWLHIVTPRAGPFFGKIRPRQAWQDPAFGRELSRLNKAIKLSPEKSTAYFELGRFYERQGRFPEAETAFKRAIDINPKDDRAYLELGWIFRVQGKSSQAEASFKKAKAIDPENYWPYVERGGFSEAEAGLKKAMSLDPKNEWLCIGLGWIYSDQDNFSGAERAFRKGIRLNPKNHWLYLELGNLYQIQGKFPEAAVLFKEVLELDPENESACFGLGAGYGRQGRYFEAEAAFKKAAELNPKSGMPFVKLGRFYLEQGRFIEAGEVFKDALEADPRNYEAYVGLGQSLRDQHKPGDAERAFKKAMELDPDGYWSYLGMGLVLQDQGRLPEAEASFKKAIEADPRDIWAYLKLGAFYRDQGKLTEAEEAFKKAAVIDPRNDWACRMLRTLYAETGNAGLALEYEKKINELKTDYYPPGVADNYHKLKAALDKKGIVYICAQYPLRSVEPLKRIFRDNPAGVVFVDNESVFKAAIQKSGYKEYFSDMFAGDFGHCTPEGNRLLAENVADVILGRFFAEKR